MKTKTIGILAGLGPLAGAHFYRRLVEMTPAINDQTHAHVILISEPAIPSRIDHLEGTGASPVPQLVEVIRRLEQGGAELIVVPSTTTNIYYDELAAQANVPILSMIAEVSEAIAQRDLWNIGILATTPTRTYGIYEQHFRRLGLEAVYPDDASQDDVTRIIAEVKASGSDLAALQAQIREIASRPWQNGVDALLLACTEIPVIFPVADRMHTPVLKSTDLLAAATIRAAGFAVNDAC